MLNRLTIYASRVINDMKRRLDIVKRTITKIEPTPKIKKKTKVRAYARVSSGKDAMLHSLAAQINYNKKLIQDNHGWEFVGVYADEALTGTKDSREEFQKLLTVCRDGKVDMILTKSISRFARNTVTLLETVRELKALSVDVFFEEQNIHSISGEGEMILTLLASKAQEESRSVSENMKWRIKKDFEQGIMWGGNSCYGYSLENKQLILIPREAEVVRSIFQLYVDGTGADTIGKILDSKGIQTKYSAKWNRSTIMTILSNYNYTGDLILQKTYRENHLSKRKIINSGELDRYAVKNHHQAIISKELFDEVQRIREERSERIKSHSNNKHYPFQGMIRCGICGRAYTHKTTPHNEIWKCSLSVTKGKEACNSKQVPHNIIVEVTKHILGMDQYDEAHFNSKVSKIIVMPNSVLQFKMKDGTNTEYVWNSSRSDSWNPEMREQARQRALKQHQGGVQNG
jgi:DNA invertase Pin-like site-specific DNA recombinase